MAVSVLQRVLSRWRPAPIATVVGLRTFLEERALLIAQKCAIDYCRGKTGLASYALFSEDTFLKALEVCRWEGFAAVLGDLLILAEAHLRAEAGAQRRAQLRDALLAMHSEILTSAAAPAHRAQGWHDVIARFAGRLEAASAAAPQAAVQVADHSAQRLFETLPIHSSYRELDEEVVFGAVRFRMVAVNGEMGQRIVPARLVRELLG